MKNVKRSILLLMILVGLSTFLHAAAMWGNEESSNVPIKILDNARDVTTDTWGTFVILQNGDLVYNGPRAATSCGGYTEYKKIASNVRSIDRSGLYITNKNELFAAMLEKADSENFRCTTKLQDNVEWTDGTNVVRTDKSLLSYSGNWFAETSSDNFRDDRHDNIRENKLYPIMNDIQRVYLTYNVNFQNYLIENLSLFILKTDDKLYVKGSNKNGQLGTGDRNEVTDFTMVLSDVEKVFVDDEQTFVIKKDKSLWVCGKNWGNFGNGSGASSYTFIKIAVDVIDVQAVVHPSYDEGAGAKTFILKTDGSLWLSGNNVYKYSGDNPVEFIKGIPENNLSFVKVFSDIKKFALDFDHILFIKSDNSLWGLGSDESGL